MTTSRKLKQKGVGEGGGGEKGTHGGWGGGGTTDARVWVPVCEYEVRLSSTLSADLMDFAAVESTECLNKLRGGCVPYYLQGLCAVLFTGAVCRIIYRGCVPYYLQGLCAVLFTGGAVQCFQADVNHVTRPFDRKSFTRDYKSFTILTPFTVGSVLWLDLISRRKETERLKSYPEWL